jgi:tetratricopeptide (TPR) repeat protein
LAATGKTLYERGVACEQAGDLPGAFEAFRLSAKANPRLAAPFVGLSRVLLHNHQRAEGIACLERAVACEPNNAVVHRLLGQALTQGAQLERAQGCFEQALRLDPTLVDAALGLAGVFEDLGDRGKAADIYRDQLQRAPEAADCLAGLLAVAEGASLDEAVGLARTRLQTAADRDAALIGYALGKALARLGKHDAAFEAWTKANAARTNVAGRFDRGHFDRRIDRLIEIFSAAFFAERRGWGEESALPVFVVGLPRSGTTLTEQILAGHPRVFAAGELDVLTDMATGTPDRLGRPDPPWPETAPQLTREIVSVIARDHRARLRALAPTDVRYVVDKQPLNFWHLGLVALTFPHARVVHCRRDLRDNGLSIYAENFTPEQRWSTDLSDIAHYWRGYRRLMEHWSRVSGLEILNVDYEDTVADLEGQARQLTQFLGLPWDDAVLSFHESARAVQTPSRWQVRRPLYASSVGRWRHYERQLAPLRQALEGHESAAELHG